MVVLGPVEFCSLLLRGLSIQGDWRARRSLPGVAVVMFGRVVFALGRRGSRYACRVRIAG